MDALAIRLSPADALTGRKDERAAGSISPDPFIKMPLAPADACRNALIVAAPERLNVKTWYECRRVSRHPWHECPGAPSVPRLSCRPASPTLRHSNACMPQTLACNPTKG